MPGLMAGTGVRIFEQMFVVQAEIIDQQLIKAGLYITPIMQNFVQHGNEIPEQILESLNRLFLWSVSRLNSLSIQSLMDSLDEFLFSAAQFLPPAMLPDHALVF